LSVTRFFDVGKEKPVEIAFRQASDLVRAPGTAHRSGIFLISSRMRVSLSRTYSVGCSGDHW
jgi:hypothetical protein